MKGPEDKPEIVITHPDGTEESGDWSDVHQALEETSEEGTAEDG